MAVMISFGFSTVSRSFSLLGVWKKLSAAISRDDGETWDHLKDLERRPGGASLTPAVTFLGDEALLTYATQAVRQPLYEKYDIRLKIIPIDWFYR